MRLRRSTSTSRTRIGPGGRNGEKSLETSTPPEPERLALESQVRECFGRCAYTHKTHEKMAERGGATPADYEVVPDRAVSANGRRGDRCRVRQKLCLIPLRYGAPVDLTVDRQ
ncbi:MAG: hypothetical protein ACXVBV_19625 [Isosphaeraceae bacterium]